MNCGEPNLQFLLQPARLEKALDQLDTSQDGELDIDEWEEAIHRGLAKRLDQLAEERERRERAAAAADAEFSAEFLSMAREVFDMIDEDQSGTLVKDEIVTAIKSNKKVRARAENAVASRLAVTSQLRSLISSPTAATRTCNTCSSRRASRTPWPCWTRTATARSTPASGAQRRPDRLSLFA